jgi:hypothetical protein
VGKCPSSGVTPACCRELCWISWVTVGGPTQTQTIDYTRFRCRDCLIESYGCDICGGLTGDRAEDLEAIRRGIVSFWAMLCHLRCVEKFELPDIRDYWKCMNDCMRESPGGPEWKPPEMPGPWIPRGRPC